MTQIITISVYKGGVAKTTTAAALAQAAAHKGRRVLAVDLDAQGNLSLALAAEMLPETGNSYNLLMGLPAADLIQTTPQGIDAIPACLDLLTVYSGPGSARRLQKALEPVKKEYDLIVIDTPTAAELQYNALQAATGLIIPLQADSYNIQSLYMITDVAAQIKKSNPALNITGIVITDYNGRTRHAKQVSEAIQDQAASMGVPYLGTIRHAIAVQEAATVQQSLFDYAPKSTAAADYLKLYETITGQEE